MVLCALLLLGFTLVEIADVVARNLRRPWLDANEFAAGFFVWGVFLGMGVAVRRDQHFRLTAIAQTMRGSRRTMIETFNRLVILGVALSMVVFGYKNYLTGFGSGYVLRKWNVLDSPRRAARALLQAGILCAGQALFDRTVAGARGRLDGFAAAADVAPLPYPSAFLRDRPPPSSVLARRVRRRGRLRRRAAS